MKQRGFCFLALLWCLCACRLLSGYEYTLSITAIFRDEAPYIKEWIEYHKLVGVEHFYLYNNLSQDNYQEVLAPYIAKGEVDLIEWPHESANLAEWDSWQVAAYNDVLKLAKKQTKWLAIIDLDEYIVPVIADTIPKILKSITSSSACGGACAMWTFYGTSHVEKIPDDKLMIETLILHDEKDIQADIKSIWNQGAYKSIVRPKYVRSIPSPHFCKFTSGRDHDMFKFNEMHIHHYWARDEHYLHQVKIPRRELWGLSPQAVLNGAAGMNQRAENNHILRFVPALRRQMGLDPKPPKNSNSNVTVPYLKKNAPSKGPR